VAAPEEQSEGQQAHQREHDPQRVRTGAGEPQVDAVLAGQAHRRSQHERPLVTVRLGQRLPLGRRLAFGYALGGPPEVSMIGRGSTPPPGAGHSLANARAWSRSAASIR
jgi:hypothetical protein